MNMRNVAHPSGGMGSSNPCRWRGERLHHHGDGVWKVICAFFVVFDSWLVGRTHPAYVLEVLQSEPHRLASYHWGYGTSLGGPLCNTHNPILRLFSCTCLHTTSEDNQTRPRKKHKRWWSYLPLQRRGFDESMPLEGWAAFRIFFPMPLSKWFNKFNKLK